MVTVFESWPNCTEGMHTVTVATTQQTLSLQSKNGKHVLCWLHHTRLSTWFVAKFQMIQLFLYAHCNFFCSFQIKLRMQRSSLLWVSVFICFICFNTVWTFSHFASMNCANFVPECLYLCFRRARLWEGHPVWADSGQIRLHPPVVRRPAPRWGGLRLREGQAAPGHHAEGRARPPGERAP